MFLFYLFLVVFWLLILVLTIGCWTRFLMAIFLAKSRAIIRKYPLLHLAWLLASVAVFAPIFLAHREMRFSTRARTVSSMSQIHSAILSYETEFGIPPKGKNNAEITQELVGNNPRTIPFLAPMPRDLNGKKELIDSWGTPFRISILDPKNPLIQSAGPDRKWNTSDDLSTDRLPY
jgi:hypothetical protein